MLINLSLSEVKGITPKKLEIFNEMGLYSVKDLFTYFPYRYENYQTVDLGLARHGDKVTVESTIHSEPIIKYLTNKRNMMLVKVIVDNQIITAVWFNRGFLKNQLSPGRPILLTGKWDKNRLQITVAESEFLDRLSFSKKDNLMPIYSIPSNLYQSDFQKIMNHAVSTYYDEIIDYLPDDIISNYKLYSLKEAIRAIHFPKDSNDQKHAKRRLVYDELLLYQLRLQINKKSNTDNWVGTSKNLDKLKINSLIKSLPYKLTNDQNIVLKEILEDMNRTQAMNRLLQGDVGSGKTIIAIISLYANYLAGFQGAFMAPTEILAGQHEDALKSILAPLGAEIELLTGSLTAKNKKDILGRLQMGLIDIIVGTHALIQEKVFYKNLGFIIIDEQHRFGVEQRAELRKKGDDIIPDVLFMTATPIPRTLAITAYGDLDISTIKEYPAGRKKINTYWVKHSAFNRVLDFMKKQIELGRQAYVICPLIEESETIDVQNAIDLHQLITKQLPEYNIGLMHGRLPSKEKEEIISQFKNNQTQVLVSTTVVEVGVNITNVTLMVIYDADRFGLAQLHQLRGRVGRGNEQSYCILVADPNSKMGKERMQVMLKTNDGFEIAKKDLELRGAGDLLGIKQSGMPDFRLADLVEDFRTLEVARDDAIKWVVSNQLWEDSKFCLLLKELDDLQNDLIKS